MYRLEKLWNVHSGWPIWRIGCAILATCWVWTAWDNYHLRERTRLLGQVVTIQEQWCTGLGRVNMVCEQTLGDLAMRLGLDADLLPLVTTALWKRSMPNVTVNRARRKLGGPTVSGGALEDPRAAMGGPSEAEEKALKRK